MDHRAALTELGEYIAAELDELQVYPRPETKPEPPALIIGFPVTEYDQTGGRGNDVLDASMVVIVGRIDDQAVADRLLDYQSGSGPKSIKTIAESNNGNWSHFWNIDIQRSEPDTIRFNDVDYACIIFDFRISGPGGF